MKTPTGQTSLMWRDVAVLETGGIAVVEGYDGVPPLIHLSARRLRMSILRCDEDECGHLWSRHYVFPTESLEWACCLDCRCMVKWTT